MSETFSPDIQNLLERVPAPAGSRVTGVEVGYDADGLDSLGYLARDEAITSPRPAVLLVHDWIGESEYSRARALMLARLGYVVFSADFYGAGVRPEGDERAALAGSFYQNPQLFRSRAKAAYDTMLAQPGVDATRTAVMGYCFGGTAAIEFARTGEPLSGAVSFHGGLITHDPSDADRIQAPILVLTGGADPAVSDEAVSAFQDELRTAPDVDWQVFTYSGAPHGFTRPGDAYREGADRRSWRAMLDFFDEIFA